MTPSRVGPPTLVWIAALIAIVCVGGWLIMDLSGRSGADQFFIERGFLGGLRIYLWVEGSVLAATAAAVGAHVISCGLAVRRGERPGLFGISVPASRIIPSGAGYVLVVLGAGLVALSITTLVLFNSCRYMRLI